MFLTGLTAASSVYGNCIHIEATEKLMESFDRENNISPSLARDILSWSHLPSKMKEFFALECLNLGIITNINLTFINIFLVIFYSS